VLAMVDLSPLALAVVVVVLGAGLYGVNPARDALISDLSPPEYEGRIFGYLFTATSLVGAAFPTVIGYLLEVLGMRQGFLMLAIGTILASGCIALLYSDRIYRVDADTDARTSPSD
jgi:MFS family permease